MDSEHAAKYSDDNAHESIDIAKDRRTSRRVVPQKLCWPQKCVERLSADAYSYTFIGIDEVYHI